MTGPKRGNLRLGSNVVELLLPQKRPFLMVDFTDSWKALPRPMLTAGRHITANDPVFAGHFPALHTWPGTHTIEGLGQTSALLMAILLMRRAMEAEDIDPDVVLGRLKQVDMGYRLHPGYRQEEARQLLDRLAAMPPALALGGSVEMRFLQPVFAGCRLDYRSTLLGEIGDLMRFDVEATVDGAVVAKGTMSGARVLLSQAPVRLP
jgi:3-hydroxyacyl-[acyl-carrier-protein] dehydratase